MEKFLLNVNSFCHSTIFELRNLLIIVLVIRNASAVLVAFISELIWSICRIWAGWNIKL